MKSIKLKFALSGVTLVIAGGLYWVLGTLSDSHSQGMLGAYQAAIHRSIFLGESEREGLFVIPRIRHNFETQPLCTKALISQVLVASISSAEVPCNVVDLFLHPRADIPSTIFCLQNQCIWLAISDDVYMDPVLGSKIHEALRRPCKFLPKSEAPSISVTSSEAALGGSREVDGVAHFRSDDINSLRNAREFLQCDRPMVKERTLALQISNELIIIQFDTN